MSASPTVAAPPMMMISSNSFPCNACGATHLPNPSQRQFVKFSLAVTEAWFRFARLSDVPAGGSYSWIAVDTEGHEFGEIGVSYDRCMLVLTRNFVDTYNKEVHNESAQDTHDLPTSTDSIAEGSPQSVGAHDG